jgi:hypothetical protein
VIRPTARIASAGDESGQLHGGLPAQRDEIVFDADSRRPNSRLANRYARPAVSWNLGRTLPRTLITEEPAMDAVISGFVRVGSLDELKLKGRLLLHGRHCPILLVQEGGRVPLVTT